MSAKAMLAERRRFKGRRTMHRGRLCSGCKMNRRRMGGGRSRSAERLAWKRSAPFRLYTRSMTAPMYWCLHNHRAKPPSELT